ncbi:MAG: ABC transporter ATP-binding protein [Gemmataceae bacterium]
MSLDVRGLTKDFPTRSGPLSVLRGIDLTLGPGDAVAVMGPSGSGKSTLLYILGTLDAPTAGTVHIDGKDPFALTEVRLAAFRNRTLGFVFQDHHLLPQCTVLENVLLPTLVGPDDSSTMKLRARALLEKVGLGARLDHRPAELSGGERQRVSVARALVHKPAVVLADEPTGNLDRTSAKTVGEMLLSLCRDEGSILVAVTHSAELAATFPKTRVMDDGRLVEARA